MRRFDSMAGPSAVFTSPLAVRVAAIFAKSFAGPSFRSSAASGASRPSAMSCRLSLSRVNRAASSLAEPRAVTPVDGDPVPSTRTIAAGCSTTPNAPDRRSTAPCAVSVT